MAVEIEISHFSIRQICESGQCFRMTETDPGRYRLIACGRMLEIEQSDSETVTFHCSEEEYQKIWKEYFDLEADYQQYIDKIDECDMYLIQAAKFGSGVRILRQDLWEMIISFIVSQQNNIKRIRKCIDVLCKDYGTNCGDYHDFPSPVQLARATEEKLRAAGLGYRSRYLAETARWIAANTGWLETVSRLPYRKAKEELIKLPGIGVKVAECVCLFGLHHLDAFPVDTHIRQVLDQHYRKGFPVRRYKGCRGVLQQYIFYYDLIGNDEDIKMT